MYFLDNGVTRCGYYECNDCGTRFLHETIVPKMICPYCGEEPDMELGPDDVVEEVSESAVLVEEINGLEEVERMDGLLSLASTGGDYNWI